MFWLWKRKEGIHTLILRYMIRPYIFFSTVFDALKEYAYRPFSGDWDSSRIAPGSYFVFRYFLDEAKDSGKDVALINTWVRMLLFHFHRYQKISDKKCFTVKPQFAWLHGIVGKCFPLLELKY